MREDNGDISSEERHRLCLSRYEAVNSLRLVNDFGNNGSGERLRELYIELAEEHIKVVKGFLEEHPGESDGVVAYDEIVGNVEHYGLREHFPDLKKKSTAESSR